MYLYVTLMTSRDVWPMYETEIDILYKDCITNMCVWMRKSSYVPIIIRISNTSIPLEKLNKNASLC